jgi:hypothetical protein
MKSAEEIANVIVDNFTSDVNDVIGLKNDIIKVIQSERARAEKLREALGFYASGEHMEADDYEMETNDQGDFDIHEYHYGLRARQALKDLDK